MPKAALSCELCKQIMCQALKSCSFHETSKYKGKQFFLAQTLKSLFTLLLLRHAHLKCTILISTLPFGWMDKTVSSKECKKQLHANGSSWNADYIPVTQDPETHSMCLSQGPLRKRIQTQMVQKTFSEEPNKKGWGEALRD